MNLAKLFETQKVLRDRINYNEPDRFNKLILALLVELGELANKWEGFKFWKKTPNKYLYGEVLEEYVDGIHFVLELGIELGEEPQFLQPLKIQRTTVNKFIDVYFEVSDLAYSKSKKDYIIIFRKYLALGEMLGFTWEQIEEAYHSKNTENHRRQDTGY